MASAVVSETHLAEIAQQIKEWEKLAPCLSVDEAEMIEIKKDNQGFYGQQKISFLRKWKQKYGDKASYLCLHEAVKKANEQQLASYIAGLIGKS